jgi:peptidoglycan/xylan/chitin deacetylase (PgdA/CDA1 family)
MTRRSLRLFFFIVLFLLVAVVPGAAQDTPQPIPPSDLGSQAERTPWDGTFRRIRVPILMYHYVSPLPPNADDVRRELSVSPEQFRSHIEYLFYEGYTAISMYQLDEALRTGTELPPKPVVLTFDDGHIDHFTNVFPVLQEFGYTGTFFVITGLTDANDPNHLSWQQVQQMSDAGMSMEPHTKNHISLRQRSYDTLIYEMLGSMESLQAYTGRMPHIFSYPVGHYDNDTLSVARTLPIWRAVTTEAGRWHTTDNQLTMPRVRIPGNLSATGLASILQEDA